MSGALHPIPTLKEMKRAERAGERTCYRCENLYREEESWEMSHIWWWGCGAKESRAWLSSFPYLNTECPDFTPRAKQKWEGEF